MRRRLGALIGGHGKLAAVVALTVAALAVISACTADPTPTPTAPPSPTPTPTPTPTPPASLVFDLAADATVGDLAALLPEATLACVVEALGQTAYDSALTLPLFGGDNPALEAEFPTACISQEIVVDLIIATYVHEAGGLSDPTITCMGKSFEDLDIAAVFDGDVETAIISALLGTLLCLTDDEASRISAGALIGEQLEGRPTLQDMRCVLQLVDLSDLMALLSGFETADEPDFETLLPLHGAFGECGIEIFDDSTDMGGGTDGSGSSSSDDAPIDVPDLSEIDLSSLPPEAQALVVCLQDAFGEETFAGIIAGTYELSLADFGKLSDCGITLANIGELLHLAETLGG